MTDRIWTTVPSVAVLFFSICCLEGTTPGQDLASSLKVLSSDKGFRQFVLQPLPGAKGLGIRFFHENQPPHRIGDDRGQTVAGKTLVGGLTSYSSGGWKFTVGRFQSGWVAPTPLFSTAGGDQADGLLSSAMGFRGRSSFEPTPGRSLTLWKGSFRHTGVAYRAPSGALSLSFQSAEAERDFFAATGASDKAFAEETGLVVPLTAMTGLRVRQGEFLWKPEEKTQIRAFGVTAFQQDGYVGEGRQFLFESSGLRIGQSALRVEGAERLGSGVRSGQVSLANRFLSSSDQWLTPLTLSELVPLGRLEVKTSEYGYQEEGIQWALSRRDLRSAEGAFKQEGQRVSLNDGKAAWSRERLSVGEGTNPEALKVVGAGGLLPWIGWHASKEQFRLQLSPKDTFSRQEVRFSRGTTLVSQSRTEGQLLSGGLRFSESRERLDASASPDFIKIAGLEKYLSRYGWSSLSQELSLALSKDDQIRFQRLSRQRDGARAERLLYGLTLESGKIGLERIRDEVSPEVSPETLQKVGAGELAHYRGWKEIRDRLSWQATEGLQFVVTRSQGEGRQQGEGQRPERSGTEAMVHWKGSPSSSGQIVIGEWKLKPAAQTPEVRERYLTFSHTASLPLLSGLRVTVNRQLSEKKEGEREQDFRLHRTVIETDSKSAVQLKIDRTTQEETGQRQKETLMSTVSVPLGGSLQLTSRLEKRPDGDRRVTVRSHGVLLRAGKGVALATGVTSQDTGSRQQIEKQVSAIREGSGEGRQEVRIVRLRSQSDGDPTARGWRFGWLTEKPSGLKASAFFGRMEKGDDRSGEEKIQLDIPGSTKSATGLKIGYWRLGVLEEEAGATAQELAKKAKEGEQPAPQAGVVPSTVVQGNVINYRTVSVVATSGDVHITAQVSQGETAEKEAQDQKVFLEIPGSGKDNVALRIGYWKLRPLQGDEKEIPVWRAVIPLGDARLVWGSAIYRDQQGQLPMRELALHLPLGRDSMLRVQNFTNMPADWGQNWQQRDWMGSPNPSALTPVILFARQQLAPYKMHRADLSLRISPTLKLVGIWEERLGVPNYPLSHDWSFGLEFSPLKTVQWQLDYARLKNDSGSSSVRSDLLGLSYRYRLTESRFITLSLRWMENPLVSRPGMKSDHWMMSLSLNQCW